MGAAELLSRLEGLRARGPGSWIARCPGPLHKREDRHPSLSVRECEDGTVLLKCFVGCSAAEILQARGLELRDLFPAHDKQTSTRPRRRPRLDGWDVVRVLQHRLSVVLLAAERVARGERLSPEDLATLREGIALIHRVANDAAEVA